MSFGPVIAESPGFGELTRPDGRLGCKIMQQIPLFHGAAAYSALTTGSSALFPSPGLNDAIGFPILLWSIDKRVYSSTIFEHADYFAANILSKAILKQYWSNFSLRFKWY
jgi:hypothetical protein